MEHPVTPSYRSVFTRLYLAAFVFDGADGLSNFSGLKQFLSQSQCSSSLWISAGRPLRGGVSRQSAHVRGSDSQHVCTFRSRAQPRARAKGCTRVVKTRRQLLTLQAT